MRRSWVLVAVLLAACVAWVVFPRETTVLLQPGGSVRLDLAGAPPADDMVLRVWVADDEPSVPVAVFPLAKPVPRILEGLPIGIYDIRVEIQMTRAR